MTTLIDIDYYQGAYGPTIRMGVHSTEGLAAVRRILQDLAAGKIRECRFGELAFVQLTGMDALLLKTVPGNRRKTVELERKENGANVFCWSNSLDGWNHCVGLLDGITGTIPSHQYLSHEEIDDALIVVAYLE
jgi:hypothetical protein